MLWCQHNRKNLHTFRLLLKHCPQFWTMPWNRSSSDWRWRQDRWATVEWRWISAHHRTHSARTSSCSIRCFTLTKQCRHPSRWCSSSSSPTSHCTVCKPSSCSSRLRSTWTWKGRCLLKTSGGAMRGRRAAAADPSPSVMEEAAVDLEIMVYMSGWFGFGYRWVTKYRCVIYVP